MAKVMVSFPSQFLKKVDRAARSQGRSTHRLQRVRHLSQVGSF